MLHNVEDFSRKTYRVLQSGHIKGRMNIQATGIVGWFILRFQEVSLPRFMMKNQSFRDTEIGSFLAYEVTNHATSSLLIRKFNDMKEEICRKRAAWISFEPLNVQPFDSAVFATCCYAAEDISSSQSIFGMRSLFRIQENLHPQRSIEGSAK